MTSLSSLRRHLQRATAAAALLLTASVALADNAPLDAFKANPAKSLDVSGINSLKVSKRILVPTVFIRFGIRGSVFAAKSAGSSTASAKGSFVVHGLERDALIALSKQLHDAYIAQLRAAGWEVLTYEDIKSDPGVVAMERQKGEGELNFPEQRDAYGTVYAIVAPSDAQLFKPAMQGALWPFRFVGKELNATVVVPQIDIVAPQVWAETRKGYKSASATVKTAPGMNVNFAIVVGMTPKGSGMMIKLNGSILNATTDAGAFTSAKDKTPSAANGLSKGLSILGGGGNISRASAAYTFMIDPKKFDQGALAGGDAFLAASVKAMGK
jgi:hypothetical protein